MGTMINLEMSDMANVMLAISNYEETSNYFSQLVGGVEADSLKKYWEEKIVKRTVNTWMTEAELRQWRNIDLHVISQTWGNTSYGWQTIGGSAMSANYTTIIENKWYELAFIYYGGKLAYICEMDDRYNQYKHNGYRGLPGHMDCGRNLTTLYSRKR